MAVVHTLFNIITTAMFFPFVKPFARLVAWLVRSDPAEKPHLSALKMSSRMSPVIACDQALMEVTFMKESDLDMLGGVRSVLTKESDARQEEHLVHRENVLDTVQREVTEFLGHIMTKRVSPDVAARSRRLLRLSDELESISDEAVTILKAARRLRANRQEFSEQSLNVLLAVHERILTFATDVSAYLKSPRPAFDLADVQEESRSLHELIRAARQGQLGRVSADDPDSPTRVLVELDILNAFERVRACYLNIAETLSGGKG